MEPRPRDGLAKSANYELDLFEQRERAWLSKDRNDRAQQLVARLRLAGLESLTDRSTRAKSEN